MASQSDFVYTPLEDPDAYIRLLQIAPPCDSLDNILYGTLRSFRREDAPLYSPMSYTWGTHEPSAELLLREYGDHGWKHFAIRPNLEELLKQCRDSLRCEYIWVDAICINQADNDEKAYQVRNMDKVYRGRDVNIWLGSPSQNSDLAMDLFNQFQAEIPLPVPSGSSRDLNKEVNDFLKRHPISLSTWQAVYDLVRRPWFSRRWIVQEVVLSLQQQFWVGPRRQWFAYLYYTTAILGKQRWYDELDESKHFPCPTSSYPHFHALPSPELDPIQAVERLWRTYEICVYGATSKLTLEWLLDSFSGFFSYDPRDAIYAFLSMASDVDVLEWMPDYSDKNRTTDLYARAAHHIIGKSRRLELICRCAQLPDFALTVSHPTGFVPWFGPQKVDLTRPADNGDGQELLETHTYLLQGYNTKSLTTFGQLATRLKAGEPGWKSHIHCDGCDRYVPFNGVKCQNCADFDYCRACSKRSDITHDPTHKFKLHNGAVYFAAGPQELPFVDEPDFSRHVGKSNLMINMPCHMVDSITAVGTYGAYVPIDRSNRSTPHSCIGIDVEDWLTLSGMENHLDEDGVPDESFCRTITGNRIIDGNTIRHATESWIRQVRKLMVRSTTSEDGKTRRGFLILEDNFAIRKSVDFMFSSQRRFATTSKSLGMVPTYSAVGDRIGLVMGCSVPIVLREASIGDKIVWKLIGECYIDGIMDGEYIEGLGKDDCEEEIAIC